MLNLSSVDYAGECVKFSAVPIAIFELLPHAKRVAIEEKINSTLNGKLVVRLLLLCVCSYALLAIFPYIAPYLVALGFVLAYLAFKLQLLGRALGKMSGEYLGFGCCSAIIGVTLVLLIPGSIAVKIFWVSLSLLLVNAAAIAVFPDDKNIQESMFAQVIIVLFVALPCGMGEWPGAGRIGTILRPYEWAANSSRGTIFDPLVPDVTAQTLYKSYHLATSTMEELLPNFLRYWKPFANYFIAADGYLLICGVATQVLLLWFLWRLIWASLCTIFFAFICFARWLKHLLHIEDRLLIPIGGGALFIIGETISFAAKTIGEFNAH